MYTYAHMRLLIVTSYACKHIHTCVRACVHTHTHIHTHTRVHAQDAGGVEEECERGSGSKGHIGAHSDGYLALLPTHHNSLVGTLPSHERNGVIYDEEVAPQNLCGGGSASPKAHVQSLTDELAVRELGRGGQQWHQVCVCL